jgi:hypothetical protein
MARPPIRRRLAVFGRQAISVLVAFDLFQDGDDLMLVQQLDTNAASGRSTPGGGKGGSWECCQPED